MIKKLLAIIVIITVASLSVAGCTANNTNQTPTVSSAQHDAFLENFLTALKNKEYSDSSVQVTAWDVTWINSTSASLQQTYQEKTTNRAVSLDETMTVFPTIQDATNYLDTVNLTAYSLASTTYPSGGAYQNATGHAPQIYKDYVWNGHDVSQLDTIVITSTTKTVATPTQTSPTTVVLPSTPPANIQSYTGPFVGSINSHVYHYPWCYEAEKILAKNLVTFATVADACAAGYRPCEVCTPPACNPAPTPIPAPSTTPTPSPTIQVIISGPTTLSPGQGGTWTATVLVNGVAIPQSQLTGKMYWFIDGQYHPTNIMTGATVNGAVMVSDANGESTTWAPHNVPHTLNAEYIGDPSYANASITVVAT